MFRSTFALQFRERVGETPIAYLTGWRMMLASEKLIQSRVSMTSIATSLDYELEQAFSTAFKRVVGSPPRQYERSENKARCLGQGRVSILNSDTKNTESLLRQFKNVLMSDWYGSS